MAHYFQDHRFKSFFWVVRSEEDRQIIGQYVYAPFHSRLLVRNFIPHEHEDSKYPTYPPWVLAIRPAYVDHMAKEENAKPLEPRVIKPNPALPILHRLSGIDDEKIKEIIGV